MFIDYTLHSISATRSSSNQFPQGTCQIVFLEGTSPILSQNLSSKALHCIRQTSELGDMPESFATTHLTPLAIPNNFTKQRIMMVQLGKNKITDENKFLEVSKSIASNLQHTRATTAAISIRALLHLIKGNKPSNNIEERLLSLIFREILLACYHNKKSSLRSIRIDTSLSSGRFSILSKRAVILAQEMAFAIKLANLPSNICTPSYFAEQCKKRATPESVSVKIHNATKLKKMKMGGIIAVGKGSANTMCLLELHYKPAKSKRLPLVLIGKGVTFDSGGISLKPAKQMDEMKYDMCGASTAVATLFACAKAKATQPIVALIPLVENMPSSTSVKPGDVITMHSGKTVEVLNTDAEGRLILADALSYAKSFKPSSVIDIATLTGAAIVALGRDISAVLSNDQVLATALVNAGIRAFDSCWQLPLHAPYSKTIKSNFSDIANLGDGQAGTIVAGLFLEEFVSANTSWAHLDIAGVAWKTGRDKSATGRPIPLLFDHITENY